ncbi:hypothetical protein PS1_034669 [Malus domestica]
MEDPNTSRMLEELGQSLEDKLQLTDKEKAGVVIERKDVEEALTGFHYMLLSEVLTDRVVHGEAFVDRFTSLWRGKEGVSIRDIEDHQFLVRFVAQRDMQWVLESDFPWTFQDDFVLVGDCTNRREARWGVFSLGDLWLQIHMVSPLSVTVAVVTVIGGKNGTVIMVDNSASKECIGKFGYIFVLIYGNR